MGLFLGFRENEGMCIKTGHGNIDIIVRGISGPRKNKEVDFEVKGIKGLEKKHLSCNQGLVKLTEGVFLGIRDGKFQKSGKVDVHYSGPYKIQKLKYD